MSYNGSGVYTLPGAQLVNGEIVSATENNQFRNDVATALNTAWTRDGQSTATGNIPMASHKFTGLAAGTTNGDSVRYEQTTLKTGSTGSSALPSGTTAQRDGSPAAGYTRFNTDTNTEEYYNGTSWVTVSDSATAVTLTGTQTLTNKTLTSPVINGTGVNFSDGSIQNTAATGFGFKNRIINGAMMIDQRNAGASTTPAASTYTLDRWRAGLSVASKYSVQQSTTAPVGFTNSLLVTSLSAYSVGTSENFVLQQLIEGFNTSDLGWGTANAQTVTLSFWVRSSLTGTFGGCFANSAHDRSYPFTFTISAANTWEQKSVTVAGDTSGTWVGATNGAGVRLYFNLGSGATVSATAGAWASGFYVSATGATSVVGTNGATFYITGVQLEKGSTATSFDYRPYGTELALCQRYYQVVRATWSGNTTSGENYDTAIPYQATMRSAPTGTSSDIVNLGFNAGSTFNNLTAQGGVVNAVCNATNSGRKFVRDCSLSAEL